MILFKKLMAVAGVVEAVHGGEVGLAGQAGVETYQIKGVLWLSGTVVELILVCTFTMEVFKKPVWCEGVRLMEKLAILGCGRAKGENRRSWALLTKMSLLRIIEVNTIHYRLTYFWNGSPC